MLKDSEKKLNWERALAAILEEVSQRHYHHYERMQFHKKRDTNLALAQIILSALTGTASIATFIESLPDIIAKSIIAILALSMAIVTGIRQHWRFGDKVSKHNAAVSRCAEMSRSIAIARWLEPDTRKQMREQFRDYLYELSDLDAQDLTNRRPVIADESLQASNEDTNFADWFGYSIDDAVKRDRF